MLRLATENYNRFVQAERFGATYGGAEANVSVSLAQFGVNTSFISKVPEHEIGQAAINSLRRYGVDTSNIVRGGERLGIYYLETGAAQRASKVIYDRAESAITKAMKSDFNWDEIFKGASWFHFTGITPALGDNLVEICLDACETAKKLGITISCDLNYREKLWSREEARVAMSKLCNYVDVCITNIPQVKDIFGIEMDSGHQYSQIDENDYRNVGEKLQNEFPFKQIAFTTRTSISASDNKISGILYDEGKCYFAKAYDIHIVDRVGGGDAFAAGLIFGGLEKWEPQECIEFAVAADCLKHTVQGDVNLVSEKEVLSLAKGSGNGLIQR